MLGAACCSVFSFSDFIVDKSWAKEKMKGIFGRKTFLTKKNSIFCDCDALQRRRSNFGGRNQNEERRQNEFQRQLKEIRTKEILE
jgi:hypothetical protein